VNFIECLTLYRMVMPIGTPFLKEKINNESMIKMPNIYIFGKLAHHF